MLPGSFNGWAGGSLIQPLETKQFHCWHTALLLHCLWTRGWFGSHTSVSGNPKSCMSVSMLGKFLVGGFICIITLIVGYLLASIEELEQFVAGKPLSESSSLQ